MSTEVDKGNTFEGALQVSERLRVLVVQTEERDSIAGLGFSPYERWIASMTGLALSELDVVNVADGDSLPRSWTTYDGIIAGGSGHNTDEPHSWIWKTRDFLTGASLEVPTIALCFSHQLTMEGHGGQTGSVPDGYHFDTETHKLTPAGKEHPLFKGMDEVVLFKSHGRMATHLPPVRDGLTIVELATSSLRHEIVAIGGTGISIQGHPDLSLEQVQVLGKKRIPKLNLDPEGEESLRAKILKEGSLAEEHGKLLGHRFVERFVQSHHATRLCS